MNQELPNILIDGIPFILSPKWLEEWNSGGRVIHKVMMHDEEIFFWFMFDRNTHTQVRGMEQFKRPAEELSRIILPADLFRRIDYHKEYHHGGFCAGKEHNYQLLPEQVALYLVAELEKRNVKALQPELHVTVWDIIDNMPAELKIQKKWKKPEVAKKRGPPR